LPLRHLKAVTIWLQLGSATAMTLVFPEHLSHQTQSYAKCSVANDISEESIIARAIQNVRQSRPILSCPASPSGFPWAEAQALPCALGAVWRVAEPALADGSEVSAERLLQAAPAAGSVAGQPAGALRWAEVESVAALR
jgi:hypothetical protein